MPASCLRTRSDESRAQPLAAPSSAASVVFPEPATPQMPITNGTRAVQAKRCPSRSSSRASPSDAHDRNRPALHHPQSDRRPSPGPRPERRRRTRPVNRRRGRRRTAVLGEQPRCGVGRPEPGEVHDQEGEIGSDIDIAQLGVELDAVVDVDARRRAGTITCSARRSPWHSRTSPPRARDSSPLPVRGHERVREASRGIEPARGEDALAGLSQRPQVLLQALRQDTNLPESPRRDGGIRMKPREPAGDWVDVARAEADRHGSATRGCAPLRPASSRSRTRPRCCRPPR